MEKTKKKKSWVKILVIILIVLFFLYLIVSFVAAALSGNGGGDSSENPTLYKVAKQDISEYINASGTISSDANVSITSTLVGSKISDLYVEVGDTVSEGQKIATVDVSELKQELNEYKTLSSKKKAELEKNYNDTVAERDEALADIQEEINDAKAIIDGCTADPTNCDSDALTEATVTKASAEKNYTKTEKQYKTLVNSAYEAMNETDDNASKIKELQNKINSSVIYSPAAGIITSLSVNKGSIISDTTVGIVQNSEDYKITVSISESSILKVKTGMPVSITVVATGDKKYSGTVTKVVKLPSSGGDYESVGYKAVISIDDKNTELLIGMTAKCKIYLSDNSKDVLAVPYDAIHEDNSGQKYVYVLTEDLSDYPMYVLSYKNVTIGKESTYYTEIKSGLEEGELLYVSEEEFENGYTFSKEILDDIARYIGGKND